MLLKGDVEGRGSVELRASKFDTVKDLKQQVAADYEVSLDDFVFLLDGEVMPDERHIVRDPYAASGAGDAYGLKEGDVIEIHAMDTAAAKFPAAPLEIGNYTEAQLTAYFTRLFSLADADSNGVLDPAEVKNLLKMTGFALPADKIAQLVEEADANKDGVIDYKEFVPMMLSLLRPKKLLAAVYTEPQLRAYFTQLFQIADTNEDGVLDKEEMTDLLEKTGFEFSADEVKGIMQSADVNNDGVISYEEFIPMIIRLL